MSVAQVDAVEGMVAHAQNAFALNPNGFLLSDAVAFGVRFAFPRAYAQSVRDQACIGEIVPALRRLADVLEAGAAR